MVSPPEADEASPLSVVVNVPAADVSPLIATIDAMGLPVEVTVTDYDITHEVRGELAADPANPAVLDRVPPLSDDQRQAFAGASVILGLDLPLGLCDVAPGLRWVQVIGSGTDLCVPAGLVGAPVLVTNAAGVSAGGISEFVLARLFEHWKRLPDFARAQENRTWQYEFGRRVAGRTVLIVGLGAIGEAVACRARGLGMKVIATRRSFQPGDVDERVDELHGADELLALVSRADAVVVCATGTPANESLISREVLAAMRDDAILVNVSRGVLVDEEALADALRSGTIAAAALDVTRIEPLPEDSPLWSAPNLRLSPHSSATMDGYFESLYELFVMNLERFLRGESLDHVVDLSARYPMICGVE